MIVWLARKHRAEHLDQIDTFSSRLLTNRNKDLSNDCSEHLSNEVLGLCSKRTMHTSRLNASNKSRKSLARLNRRASRWNNIKRKGRCFFCTPSWKKKCRLGRRVLVLRCDEGFVKKRGKELQEFVVWGEGPQKYTVKKVHLTHAQWRVHACRFQLPVPMLNARR